MKRRKRIFYHKMFRIPWKEVIKRLKAGGFDIEKIENEEFTAEMVKFLQPKPVKKLRHRKKRVKIKEVLLEFDLNLMELYFLLNSKGIRIEDFKDEIVPSEVYQFLKGYFNPAQEEKVVPKKVEKEIKREEVPLKPKKIQEPERPRNFPIPWNYIIFRLNAIEVYYDSKWHRVKEPRSKPLFNPIKSFFEKVLEWQPELEGKGQNLRLKDQDKIFEYLEMGKVYQDFVQNADLKNAKALLEITGKFKDHGIKALTTFFKVKDHTEYIQYLSGHKRIVPPIIAALESVVHAGNVIKWDLSYLFVLKRDVHFFVIWESFEEDKATYLFYGGRHESTLQIRIKAIQSYIINTKYNNKRDSLRRRLNPMILKSTGYIQNIKHPYGDFDSWQRNLVNALAKHQ